MSKQEKLNAEGIVTIAYPNGMFRVKVPNIPQEILGYVSGRMRQHFIKLAPGDKVVIELTPPFEKGRIIYRADPRKEKSAEESTETKSKSKSKKKKKR